MRTRSRKLAGVKGANVPNRPAFAKAGQKLPELDEANARILEHVQAAGRSSWHACDELRKVFDSHLWSKRVSWRGDQLYASFAEYALAELRLGKSQAYALLDVARNHSVDEVAAYGTTKLMVLIGAPPEKKAKVRTLMQSGASVRDMRRAAEKSLSDRSDSELKTQAQAAAIEVKRVELMAAGQPHLLAVEGTGGSPEPHQTPADRAKETLETSAAVGAKIMALTHELSGASIPLLEELNLLRLAGIRLHKKDRERALTTLAHVIDALIKAREELKRA